MHGGYPTEGLQTANPTLPRGLEITDVTGNAEGNKIRVAKR